MKYKKSFYNVEISKTDDGSTLFYNSFSSSFGIMDKKTQELYDKIENIDDDILKDESNRKVVDTMKTNGFIVEEEIDEFKRMQIISETSRYNTNSLNLTVAPTLDCNMACPYCFEDKSKKTMDEETKSGLIKFIKNKIDQERIQFLSITWYGGEPLLALDTILELSEKIIALCNENKVYYASSIVTNGCLLDAPTAKLLKEKCALKVAQITIDGLPEKHNRRRILKNGEDSFGIIVKNIDEIKNIIHVSVRVNVDKTNIDHTEKLVDFFIDEKNWGNEKVFFYFAPVHNMTDFCNIKSNTCYSYTEFGDIDKELIRKIYTKGNTSIIKSLYPRRTSLPCNALTVNTFVVDPDGYLYTCWNNVGVKEKSIGTVIVGPQLNKEYMDWLSLKLPHECTECKFLPLCQGGCPLERLKKCNKPNCSHRTISMSENLVITYEEYLKCTNI